MIGVFHTLVENNCITEAGRPSRSSIKPAGTSIPAYCILKLMRDTNSYISAKPASRMGVKKLCKIGHKQLVRLKFFWENQNNFQHITRIAFSSRCVKSMM